MQTAEINVINEAKGLERMIRQSKGEITDKVQKQIKRLCDRVKALREVEK